MNNLINKTHTILRNKKGEGYIDAVIIILIVMIMLAFAVSTLPIFVQKASLNIVADDIARQIEVIGNVDNNTYADARQIAADLNMSLDTVKIDPQVGHINLNEEFEVRITAITTLGFGPFIKTDLTLESVAIGKSQVYWKE